MASILQFYETITSSKLPLRGNVYKCTMVNDAKKRAVKFTLSMGEQIEYCLTGTSNATIPEFLQDDLAFDISNAAVFLSKMIAALNCK